MITGCPQCNTRFRVTAEQLAAHQGLVRCSRCQTVFNGFASLQREENSKALETPAMEASPTTIRALTGRIESAAPSLQWMPAIENATDDSVAAASRLSRPDTQLSPFSTLQGHINRPPPPLAWT